MAVNSPNHKLSQVYVDGVDLDLLGTQTTDLVTLLRETQDLPPAIRQSLQGIKALLFYILNNEGVDPVAQAKRKKMDPKMVNMIRDLTMVGKTPAGIAKQLGLKTLAVARCSRGESYLATPYEPTEFAPTNIKELLGTNAYPWTHGEFKLNEGEES